MNKFQMMTIAIEITKEYARGGGSTAPSIILENTYEMLKKIAAADQLSKSE